MRGALGAPLRWQGFGKNEISVQRIAEAQRRRRPERKTQIHVAQPPANCRANHKPESKRRADHPKWLRPSLRLSHIGYVGESRGHIGSSDPGTDEASK